VIAKKSEKAKASSTHSRNGPSDRTTLVTSRRIAFSVGNQLVGSTLEGLTGELVRHESLERVVDGIDPTKPAEPRLHLSSRNNIACVGDQNGKGESGDCRAKRNQVNSSGFLEFQRVRDSPFEAPWKLLNIDPMNRKKAVVLRVVMSVEKKWKRERKRGQISEIVSTRRRSRDATRTDEEVEDEERSRLLSKSRHLQKWEGKVLISVELQRTVRRGEEDRNSRSS